MDFPFFLEEEAREEEEDDAVGSSARDGESEWTREQTRVSSKRTRSRQPRCVPLAVVERRSTPLIVPSTRPGLSRP